MKKYFLLMGLGLLLAGCVQQPKPPHVKPIAFKPALQPYTSYTATTRTYSPSGFNAVVISGSIIANVTVQSGQNLITIPGKIDPKKNIFIPDVNTQLQNGVLYVSGHGNVTLNLDPSVQQLALGGNAAANITGQLVLSRIETTGNANLHAYWLNSTNLHVLAKDRSKLFLAGIVTDLDIIAAGDADVDAKYLRVDNSYVKTMDNADVGVTVKHALGSLSTGKSTVYYYKDSELDINYLNGSGSALRMKGIPDNRY